MQRICLFAAITACLVLAPSISNAQDHEQPKENQASEKAAFTELFDFVESNLIGRTFETSVTSRITGGELETEFHRKQVFANLVVSGDQAYFDGINLIRQKNWDIKDDKRNGEPRVKDRIVVVRYEFLWSKSAKIAKGFTRVLTNTEDVAMGASSQLTLQLDNGKLKMVSKAEGDAYAAGGKTKNSLFVTTDVFSTTHGKTSITTLEKGFEVDIETEEKTPNHNVELESKQVESWRDEAR